MMRILAIETSCDETAAAVVEDGVRVLSNVVVSQVDIFAEYGGVIPEVAARSHLEAILPIVHKALDEAGLTKDEIDAIAVTHTPGLLGSLLIGTLTARMLAILWGRPLYPVHHIKAHIYSSWIENSSFPRISSSDSPVRTHRTLSTACLRGLDDFPEFPLIALVVSGGHTQIIYMSGHNRFEIIGTTRDDAVGECFDKVAKVLGLPYPGGPNIAKCAKREDSLSGRSTASSSPVRSHRMSNTAPLRASSSPCSSSQIASSCEQSSMSSKLTSSGERSVKYRLPRPKVSGLDFSFSGLKTAVLRAVQAEVGASIDTPSYELAEKLTEEQRADFAAAFQETAAEILVEKVGMALEKYPEARSIVVAGGVSANEVLREKIKQAFSARTRVCFPEVQYTGDNAAMVGVAAYYEILSGVEATDPYMLNIAPRSDIR